MNILIVEDDLHLAEVLKEIMIKEKYNAEVVYDGQDGLDYALAGMYDLIVLDVMLPKMNGYQVVKLLRQQKISTPVIMLTAKSEIQDRVMGLDCGADDYLTKPFSPDELLARVRALTRRQGEVVLDEMTYGGVSLNLSTYMLSTLAKSVHLSHKEFQLIRLLMASPEHIVPKETMIVKIWGFDSNTGDNNVEAYISFLRKKLEYLNAKVAIRTIRKMGYKIEEDEEC